MNTTETVKSEKAQALCRFRHIPIEIIYALSPVHFGFRKPSIDPDLGIQFEEYTVISRQEREMADGPREITPFDGSVEINGTEYYCFRDL